MDYIPTHLGTVMYLVWSKGSSSLYSKNLDSGHTIDSNVSDFGALLADIMNDIPSGVIPTIRMRSGTYNRTTTATITKSCIVEGDGALANAVGGPKSVEISGATLNQDAISVQAQCTLRNLVIDQSQTSSGHGISTPAGSPSLNGDTYRFGLEDVLIREVDSSHWGVYMPNCWNTLPRWKNVKMELLSKGLFAQNNDTDSTKPRVFPGNWLISDLGIYLSNPNTTLAEGVHFAHASGALSNWDLVAMNRLQVNINYGTSGYALWLDEAGASAASVLMDFYQIDFEQFAGVNGLTSLKISTNSRYNKFWGGQFYCDNTGATTNNAFYNVANTTNGLYDILFFNNGGTTPTKTGTPSDKFL